MASASVCNGLGCTFSGRSCKFPPSMVSSTFGLTGGAVPAASSCLLDFFFHRVSCSYISFCRVFVVVSFSFSSCRFVPFFLRVGSFSFVLFHVFRVFFFFLFHIFVFGRASPKSFRFMAHTIWSLVSVCVLSRNRFVCSFCCLTYKVLIFDMFCVFPLPPPYLFPLFFCVNTVNEGGPLSSSLAEAWA